jgi:pre-mRNA-processing factor 6
MSLSLPVSLVRTPQANPDSEDIWLAAAKLEWENDEYDRARILLQKACARAPSAKVWMKLALLEREVGLTGPAPSSQADPSQADPSQADPSQAPLELPTLDQAIAKFPDFAKFYLMAGQACERAATAAAADAAPAAPAATAAPALAAGANGAFGGGGASGAGFAALAQARSYYQAGLRRCPTAKELWLAAAALEAALGQETKSRSLLELARLKNPKSDLVSALCHVRLRMPFCLF